MEWVLHPIMTLTATEKMGLMATGGGDCTVTATKGIGFFRPFRCRHSVNEPLKTPGEGEGD